jgi:omega-6 fatty acid desaturase (delta-12 desaturase)
MELVRATQAFAVESRPRSYVHLAACLALLGGSLVLAACAPWWPVRAAGSVLAGLTAVRGFILYHDYLHGAILRDSAVAKVVFYVLGLLLLTPPRSWRRSHNFHHGHVGQVQASNTGSFPVMTTGMWRGASRAKRLAYRISRHPFIIAGAYLTVFLYCICLLPLLRQPLRHADSAVALGLHAGLIAILWVLAGFSMVFFVVLLPMTIASAVGAYLFYAQHNFVGMQILPAEEWSYHRAAVASSSYMKLGPVLRWFTGNIGYHHVHHVNPTIPFYRLPEAMAAIPELQRPAVTTLRPRDVWACLRLNLWDPERRRMVRYGEA